MEAQLIEIEAQILDLQQKRVVWLEENQDFINGVFLVVSHLGVSVSERFRHPWHESKILEYKLGPIAATVFFDIGGKFIPHIQTFETRNSMNIMVGEYQVCRFVFTNHPRPNQKDYFFIPGEWMQALETALEKAQTQECQAQIEVKQKELADLQAKLLIGVDV